MDATLFVTPIILRMLERLLVVAIGGLTIYLGYRLFIDLPLQTNQQGKIELPGLSVTLSKVGPGIFFCAFGCLVIAYALAKPVSSQFTQQLASTSDGLVADAEPSAINGSFTGMSGVAQVDDANLDRARARIIEQIGQLNCLLQRQAENTALYQRSSAAVAEAKALMLASVWSEQWGEQAQLRFGQASIENETLLALYTEVVCAQ